MNNLKSNTQIAKKLKNLAFSKQKIGRNNKFRNAVNILLYSLIFSSILFHCGKKTNQKTYVKNISRFIQTGYKIGAKDTKKTIYSKLGSPIKVEKHPTDQKGANLFTLFYPGLIINVVYSNRTNKSFVTEIQISDKRYRLKWGIRVGKSTNKVKEKLGPPLKQFKNRFVYAFPENPSYIVEFYFKNNRINHIIFHYGFD